MAHGAPVCIICLTSLEGDAFQMGCGHAYHGSCIAGWFQKGTVSCPTCRFRPSLAPPRRSSFEGDDGGDEVDSGEEEGADDATLVTLEDCPPPLLHRLLRPALAQARRVRGSPRLKRIAAAYLRRRETWKELVRALRHHERHAAGPYPLLRCVTGRLRRRIRTAEARLVDLSEALLREAEDAE
jgi:hypothetical protein